MNDIVESKKNHVWRKTVWHTDPEQSPLGPHHSAEVYCSQEANGYAVWYVRKLGKEDGLGLPEVENGDYLLTFYSLHKRDEAIEFAVLIANSAARTDDVIQNLDLRCASAQKM